MSLRPLLVGFVLAVSPLAAAAQGRDSIVVLKPAWKSAGIEGAELASLAAWRGPGGTALLIAGARAKNQLVAIDGLTGAHVRTTGTEGSKAGQLSAPSGIALWNDVALVSDRDNQRVQAFSLPFLKPMGSISDSVVLVAPLGLAVADGDSGRAELFVLNDVYLSANDETHGDAFRRRVLHFRLTRMAGVVKGILEKFFGDTAKGGMLLTIAAIAIDRDYGSLLIGDVAARDLNVYTFEGSFSDEFGHEQFTGPPAGLALYACGKESGYWIATEKHTTRNRFHIYERESYKYRGAFALSGVVETDGIAVVTGKVGAMQGAFYAINGGTNIAAVSFASVLTAMKLPDPCAAAAR
jgi:3-phytase